MNKYILCIGFFMIASCLCLKAQVDLLEQSFQMEEQAGKLEALLPSFSRQSGIVLVYSSHFLQMDQYIEFTGSEKTVGDYLARMLQDQPVQIRQRNGKIFLKALPEAQIPTYTFSGYIREAESLEALVSASVAIPELGKGTYSNRYGFFSLTLPAGQYRIRFSYVGYGEKWLDLVLNHNRFQQIRLETDFELETVEILSEDASDALHQLSQHQHRPETYQALPMLLGQTDVLKQTQLLPGIQASNEGVSGLIVRGGNPDQNLMLLDGVPIYNPTHSLGLVSVFYGSAIQGSSILKGAFPAQLGGRLSAVMDVRMKEGNMQKLKGEIDVGLVSGSVRLEGPIWKNKTAFHFSARRTLLDLFSTPIQLQLRRRISLPVYLNYNFQDLNLKINHRFSANSRIYLSSYLGRDRFLYENYGPGDSYTDENFTAYNGLEWGNRMLTLRWSQILGARWFLNLTGHVSSYRYEYDNFRIFEFNTSGTEEPFWGFFSQSLIRDIGLRAEVDYYPNPTHHIKAGLSISNHSYAPYVSQFVDELDSLRRDNPVAFPEDKSFSDNLALFIQDQWDLSPTLKLLAGIRLTQFWVDGEDYLEWQPRLSLYYQFAPRQSLQFAYSRMVQFVHLLTTPGLGLPSDLWVPSTSSIRPAVAHHWNLGYVLQWDPGWQLNLEAYYKALWNLLEYQNDLSFRNINPNDKWEELVTIGSGKAWGLDLHLQKQQGKWTGGLAYSLGWSRRQFDQINDGQPFPYRFDRRHNISLNLSYKPSQRLNLGLIWVLGSGEAISLGQIRYPSLISGFPPIVPTGPRNAYRSPIYHRLDLALSLHKDKKRGEQAWIFGLYNAYNRRNPFFLYFRPNTTGGLELVQQSLLPILPYVRYRFRF